MKNDLAFTSESHYNQAMTDSTTSSTTSSTIASIFAPAPAPAETWAEAHARKLQEIRDNATPAAAIVSRPV